MRNFTDLMTSCNWIHNFLQFNYDYDYFGGRYELEVEAVEVVEAVESVWIIKLDKVFVALFKVSVEEKLLMRV